MKEQVRVLVVEDEFITLDALRDALEDMGYGISGDAMRAKDALLVLERGDTDIAILDIHLRHSESGIWLAEQINDRFGIPFIFLTAFTDKKTIAEAGATNPAAYLVKPFNQQDLYAAIELALVTFADRNSNRQENGDSSGNQLLINDSIFVKDGLSYKKIPLKDISFVEAFKNYLELVTDAGRFVVRSTLKDFLATLPETEFLQTHRSYIVNVRAIKEIGGNYLLVQDTEVPISRQLKADILRKLQLYS